MADLLRLAACAVIVASEIGGQAEGMTSGS